MNWRWNLQRLRIARMRMPSFVAVAFVCGLSSAVAASQQGNNNGHQQLQSPFKACIDDSDCAKLGQGSKFACFLYICYPWKDDSHIDPKDRRRTCRKDRDCNPGQECFRHHDKRQVNRGLCFDEREDCDTHSDCPRGQRCCSETCCEESYFNQFQSLPCTSHLGCEDLGLGRFCCEKKNSSNVCCDVDPNPPTTTQPRTASSTTGLVSLHSVATAAAASFACLALKLIIV